MTRIIHLSDLHFGTEDSQTIFFLQNKIMDLNPNLIIISGDFTQSASHGEFTTAQNFLTSLPAPYLCVAGNHDIPAHNLIERFLSPYRRYKKYISSQLEPQLRYDHIEIIGLNTARRALPHWNWANGAINEKQLEKIVNDPLSKGVKRRLCVLHHPVPKAEGSPLKVKVFGGKKALKAFEHSNVDLVLTGHVHHASIETFEKKNGRRLIFVSASTTLSSRTRSQGNGFNVIDIDDSAINIEFYQLASDGFQKTEEHHFA